MRNIFFLISALFVAVVALFSQTGKQVTVSAQTPTVTAPLSCQCGQNCGCGCQKTGSCGCQK